MGSQLIFHLNFDVRRFSETDFDKIAPNFKWDRREDEDYLQSLYYFSKLVWNRFFIYDD